MRFQRSLPRLWACRGGQRRQSTLARLNHSNPAGGEGQTIFSGIQPTGVPHLGNYLGALREWVTLQSNAAPSARLIYSLVDLHAITVRQDPAQLRRWKNESFAMLLAIGLDPSRSIIFHQSDVPAHAELMWILSCYASTGYLGRMTQWKDKTASAPEGEKGEKLKLGLFSYPVLQAADVLVHRATHVPVGHDQAQHLEFARELAGGFNHVCGENVFVLPETILGAAKRVMSLTDPRVKMSKSHRDARSRILLTDTEEMVRAKIMGAMTDSIDGITYDPEHRPGVSNLLDILYYTIGEPALRSQTELAQQFSGKSLRTMKEEVAQAVNQLLQPIRGRYDELVSNQRRLDVISSEGAEMARWSADVTLRKVKRIIGLS